MDLQSFQENQTLGIASPTVDPKDDLLGDVKLEYKWYKEGFGSMMIAYFTINNPNPVPLQRR